MGLKQGQVGPRRETSAHHSITQDGPEPDRNGPRRLEVVKTNLCRYPPALGVWFEERHSSHELDELHEGGKGGGTVPRVVYGEAPKAFKEPTQAEACGAWLVEVLEEAGEPMRPKELEGMVVNILFVRYSPHCASSFRGTIREATASPAPPVGDRA